MNLFSWIALFTLSFLLPVETDARSIRLPKIGPSGRAIFEYGKPAWCNFDLPTKKQINILINCSQRIINFESRNGNNQPFTIGEKPFIDYLVDFRDNPKIPLQNVMQGIKDDSVFYYQKFNAFIALAEYGEMNSLQIFLVEIWRDHPSHKNPNKFIPYWNKNKMEEFYRKKTAEVPAALATKPLDELKKSSLIAPPPDLTLKGEKMSEWEEVFLTPGSSFDAYPATASGFGTFSDSRQNYFKRAGEE